MSTLVDPDKLRLLELIQVAGVFESRLVEGCDTDREFLQHGVPHGFSVTEIEFLHLLHELEIDGYLEVSSTVHRYDSTEYILSWQLSSKGNAIS